MLDGVCAGSGDPAYRPGCLAVAGRVPSRGAPRSLPSEREIPAVRAAGTTKTRPAISCGVRAGAKLPPAERRQCAAAPRASSRTEPPRRQPRPRGGTKGRLLPGNLPRCVSNAFVGAHGPPTDNDHSTVVITPKKTTKAAKPAVGVPVRAPATRGPPPATARGARPGAGLPRVLPLQCLATPPAKSRAEPPGKQPRPRQ